MSTVLSIRIPRELKEKMKTLGKDVNWSSEIRRFIETRIRELERRKVLEEAHAVIEKLPKTPRGTAQKYVREDRDSH